MLRHTFLALTIALSVAACGKASKAPAPDSKQTDAATDRPILVTPEDMITVSSNPLASGPIITGSIQPQRRADLRAEVSSVVLQVLKENGEPVKRGDLLVHLDDTAIRDSLASAEASARSAAQALEQAGRQLDRLKTLRGSGMASLQQLEDAEIRRNAAQSELVAARARAAQARQQLERTKIRAPFDGIVSERKVSAGDTAQIGKELLKVIDPTSMRFEGYVSADRVSSVKVGQPVHFRVNGYEEQEFSGVVRRINPSVNPATRQVEVFVEFNGSQPRVSGLYAEGRIQAATRQALTIPESAMVRNGDKAYAWRINDNKVEKVDIAIGERDPRRGNYVVSKGLADGDKIVRNPVSSLKDGQKVEMAATAGSTSHAASLPKTTASAEN